MIDKKGYRPNVGIVIANGSGQVFWGKRVKQNAWQFPQGGIQSKESPEEALYRELHEETGLEARDVRMIAVTKDWLRYRLPPHLKRDQKTHFVGQKQKYFLIRLTSDDDAIN